MTRSEFVQKFSDALYLPDELKRQIVEEIDGHLYQYELLSEDIAESFGDPKTLAKEIYTASKPSVLTLAKMPSVWKLIVQLICSVLALNIMVCMYEYLMLNVFDKFFSNTLPASIFLVAVPSALYVITNFIIVNQVTKKVEYLPKVLVAFIVAVFVNALMVVIVFVIPNSSTWFITGPFLGLPMIVSGLLPVMNLLYIEAEQLNSLYNK